MRSVISTPNAPTAVGPYSQAVRLGDLLFCSGQIPLRPDGSLETGDTKAQTRQVMENLKAVLSAAGCGFADVVKATCFLVDMGDFAAFNEVYGAYFASEPPARATVAVAALPRGASVEVELIARIP